MKAEMDYRELVARSMVLHFAAGILLLMLTSPCRAASPVESVRLVLPENPGAITRRAAGILARQIAERCDAKVVTAGEAAFSIELGVEPGFGTEGYEIADGPSGSVRIVGNDERGLLYGIGKFLRTSRYDQGGFTPGIWRGASVPKCPMRGIYLATHFNNYYEAAPPEELDHYIEDLALWGFNLLALAYPHWQYSGYDDPAARKMTEHLRRIIRVAKEVGMRVSIGDALNGGFTSTPKELRCTPVPDPLGRHGNFGVNLCPSKRAARELLLKNWAQLLDEFADVGLDCVTYWPYDEGGCGCPDCWPWGARGYLSLSRAVSAVVREKAPHIQVILSTWTFDTPPAGEWEALAKAVAEDKTWADYIQADAHEDFPRFPLARGVPGGLPLLSFPEISMWGQNPWGGYGANPLPGRLQRLWNQTQGKLAGGTPYSEGIYEDMNKAICSQFYWDPKRSAMETVREYAAFEYSPLVADDVVQVVEAFEKNHLRTGIGPSAEEAFERARKIETKLTPRARAAWRWRIVYLRALIDQELLHTHGKLEGKALQAAFRELTGIYHAEHAHSMPIRPPQINVPQSQTTSNRTDVFDIDGKQVIQDEDHVGIANGKLTLGINYRDVAGLAGLWAPPYVSSNFMLDGRVNGRKVPTSRWIWRPFQVEREGAVDNVSVSATTTLIYGQRAAILSFTFRNSGSTPQPLELFTLGWLDSSQDWGFARPGSHSETTPEVNGRQLTLRQGNLAVVVAIDATEWTWEVSGNLGHASAWLPAQQTRSMHVIVTIGAGDKAIATADHILVDPGGAITAAKEDYARQVNVLFEKLPSLESDNAQLVRWYNRSLVHLLMNRWEVPEFVLHPYYSTGSIKGGCVANYLWNFGEVWEILPLFDAPAARSHIKQFLKFDLLKHFLFNPLTGTADGPWYMVNQEKIIGLTYYYLLLTGDTTFLNDTVDGKSIRDHMVAQAMFGDDLDKPVALIDYGPSNSHLELRRRYSYHHVMPDLNARRYANYQRAATLCELAGQPAPFLRERAELLKPLLKQRLWDAIARWFRFEDGQGQSDLRYTVQMFKPLGSGVFDKECEDGLLSHLNPAEFLSAYGLHSISKTDPAFDQLDIDNGGGGICTSFPPQIIERLYQAAQPKLAADILGRLLWWGDTMPYWGDSIAANCKDYRRDTPLQCTLDGAAGAQCILFGVFGLIMRPDGDVVIKPNRLPFAPRMALHGIKVRGRSLDIRIDQGQYEVRSGQGAIQALIGNTVLISAKDGSVQLSEQ